MCFSDRLVFISCFYFLWKSRRNIKTVPWTFRVNKILSTHVGTFDAFTFNSFTPNMMPNCGAQIVMLSLTALNYWAAVCAQCIHTNSNENRAKFCWIIKVRGGKMKSFGDPKDPALLGELSLIMLLPSGSSRHQTAHPLRWSWWEQSDSVRCARIPLSTLNAPNVCVQLDPVTRRRYKYDTLRVQGIRCTIRTKWTLRDGTEVVVSTLKKMKTHAKSN